MFSLSYHHTYDSSYYGHNLLSSMRRMEDPSSQPKPPARRAGRFAVRGASAEPRGGGTVGALVVVAPARALVQSEG